VYIALGTVVSICAPRLCVLLLNLHGVINKLAPAYYQLKLKLKQHKEGRQGAWIIIWDSNAKPQGPVQQGMFNLNLLQ